jgi:tetratricopeptide (TPR) repeat protein
MGVFLAVQMPAESAGRAQYLQTLETAARDALADESLDIAADDRSGVYGAVITAREDAKDTAGVQEWTARWADFLDTAAAKAPTPEARAVFDSHRLSAALDLGRPERVVAALQQSERDLPQDYNPPARLATAYKAMKDWDAALAASDRALAKAYGPRRIGMLQTRADIYKGRGELDAARKTLTDALREAEAMPTGQRNENTIAALKKKIDAIQVP